MIADGIDVDPASFAYSSHRSYDEQFHDILVQFIRARRTKLSSKEIDKIIILDDGGKCGYGYVHDELRQFAPLVAIKQTSSGYEAICSQKLAFPVINVARSATLSFKLESPMIAEASTERLLQKIKSFQPRNSKDFNHW